MLGLKKAYAHSVPSFRNLVDAMPVNVMTCDLKDFTIDYLNPCALETLQSIEHALPIKADEVLGSSIDVFHKNPEHQRSMLRNPHNLPHKARIRIGDEWLDLHVTALYSGGGKYTGQLVTWSVATDKVKSEHENMMMRQVLDQMPVNAMLCDISTFDITYINQTSRDTLSTLEGLLPVKVDELVGTSIDIFHKHPEHQRKLLSDEGNLPWRTRIKLGDESLDLRISAVHDENGNYNNALLTWSIVTRQVKMADDFEGSVKGIADVVASAASELQATSQNLASGAEEMSTQADTVASATEELSTSSREIGRQVHESSNIVGQAVDTTRDANARVSELADAAERINEVISMIEEIASQTKLLALNATIEAARAGEAGKGFAIVANEVKALADQTAGATSEIVEHIKEMQSATTGTVDSIGAISGVIERVNEISDAIAAAVEEQNAALSEVSQNIVGVSDATRETGTGANQTLNASNELARQGESLKSEVEKFLEEMRAI